MAIQELTLQEYREKFNRTYARERLEHDGIWRQHVALFQELRQLGIIGLLEDITQEKLHLEEIGRKMMYWFDRPWTDRWWARLETELETKEDAPSLSNEDEQLSFDLVAPNLRIDTEQWVKDARLELSKLELPYGGRRDGIILSYSPARIFQVKGRRVEFRGSLPQDKTKRLDTVKTAIDKALENRLMGNSLFRAIYPAYKIKY